MRRRRIFWGGSVVLLVFVIPGFLAWPVTGPVQWVCQKFSSENGWQLTVEKARWVPWKSLQVEDLRLMTPGGGLMHVVKMWISPKPWSVWKGSLTTLWDFGEIRLDPGSWRIRKPEVQKLLSSMPVTTGGSAIVQIQPGRITVDDLSLQGPLLKLHAKGWFSGRLATHLDLNGALARSILEGMRLGDSRKGSAPFWEPFKMRLTGPLSQLKIAFASNFLTISRRQKGEPPL